MKWKEVLFFNKKDKIAILILSCLGLILGGSYIAYPHIRNEKNQDLKLKEFSKFQKTLKPIYHSNKSNEEKLQSKQATINKNKLIEGQKIDLNSANEKALMKVPGIGAAFAKRIIEYRSALGGFSNIDQLREIKGFSNTKFEKVSIFFSLDKRPSKQSLLKLVESKHPYLDEKQIASINGYINDGNKIGSLETLQSLEHFTPRDIDRIKDYVYLK